MPADPPDTDRLDALGATTVQNASDMTGEQIFQTLWKLDRDLATAERRIREQHIRIAALEAERESPDADPDAEPMPAAVTCPLEVLTQTAVSVDDEGNRTTISAEQFADGQFWQWRNVWLAYLDGENMRPEWAVGLAHQFWLDADPRADPSLQGVLAWHWHWHNSQRSAADVTVDGVEDAYGHRTWLRYFERAEAAIRERDAEGGDAS